MAQRRSIYLSDLDRCQHARHVNDECIMCREENPEKHNLGNPYLDSVIGYALDGPITVRDLLKTIDRTGESTW